jgi:hypothetical protein
MRPKIRIRRSVQNLVLAIVEPNASVKVVLAFAMATVKKVRVDVNIAKNLQYNEWVLRIHFESFTRQVCQESNEWRSL